VKAKRNWRLLRGQSGVEERPTASHQKATARFSTARRYATLKYRIDQWHPDEIIYVTTPASNCISSKCSPRREVVAKVSDLRHVYFGSILVRTANRLKTREGAPVEAPALLNEAKSAPWRL